MSFPKIIGPGFALLLGACAPSHTAPLKTTDKVDVRRYSGKWYEVARYPQWFQRGCASATADYSLKDDGSIRVINTCLRTRDDQRSIEGTAIPVDAANNRLKVSFNNWYAKLIPVPEEGNYWIIDLTKDYRHAIVGTPDRKALWFLSRSPEISRKEFERMKRVATEQGFDPQRLLIDDHTKIVR